MNDHAQTGTSAIPPVKPYISADQNIPELTIRALITGALLGILFAASSVYLALKVGMTVSASIPIAVLSITLFRAFGRATILENNIVQTTGSAGESIAFAVATVPPALLIMGFDMKPSLVMLVATLGGLLGILMMIPLRRGLIVKEHGRLAYPEGTACAEVLLVGEKGGTDAKMVFAGFGLGALYKFMNAGLRLWSEVPSRAFSWFKGASMAAEISPELLGVGYIIGPRVAGITFAGGVLSFMVLIPAIKFFGDSLSAPLFPGTKLISEMGPMEIRNAYLLYIGAGSVTMGGMISLVRAFPSIVAAFRSGVNDLIGGRAMSAGGERTDRDIPMSIVIAGSFLLGLVLWLAPPLHLNWFGALLMIVFGFIFVTVSSRITGEIGSSSNPISGMTISALLLSCLAFVAVGWTGDWARSAVISVAAIVCVAASNGGTTSQDLKTGQLIGATPWRQQIAIAVGALSSALLVGYTLILLNDAGTCYVADPSPGARIDRAAEGTKQGPDGSAYEVRFLRERQGSLLPGQYLTDSGGMVKYLVDPGILGTATKEQGCDKPRLDAPKARLMSLIVDGIMTQKLPWTLVLFGAFISLVMELCGVAALPFAVGVYLPVSTTSTIFVGGAIRYFIEKASAKKGKTEGESSPGVLLSSGFIAGGSICGIVIALLAASGWDKTFDLSHAIGSLAENELFAMAIFAMLVTVLYRVAKRGT